MSNRVSFDFAGTAVLVTGGTSGIGHAIASAFASAGAAVTVTGTRAAAADYDTDLSAFTFRQLEIRDAAAVDALRRRRSKSLDVLVNNAGANFPDGLDEWDPDGVLGRARPQRRRARCGSPSGPTMRWRRARWPVARAW